MNAGPSKIKLHRHSQELEVVFNEQSYRLSAEFMRVHSPSAEVKGHGPGQEVLQLNKEKVAMVGIEPQGNYAIKLVFSDGHDSGIYTWAYLFDLSKNQAQYWHDYLEEVEHHHQTKDVSAIKWIDPPKSN